MCCNKKIPSKTLYRQYKNLLLKRKNGSRIANSVKRAVEIKNNILKSKQIEEIRLILCTQ
jgi:hypothetical protein